ncbi:MAG: DUF4160 domain-containing protein [Chromatiaceae bacterium]|nr:DUF4160 domain-containing protein [Chromatiaceae bacterium]
MFWREHAPPHFHALYPEHEALIDIHTLEVIGGRLPKRALSLFIEWVIGHREGLIEDWKFSAKPSSCRNGARLWSDRHCPVDSQGVQNTAWLPVGGNLSRRHRGSSRFFGTSNGP